jgi:hypothetical protein
VFRRMGAVARRHTLRWDIDVCALTNMVRITVPQPRAPNNMTINSISYKPGPGIALHPHRSTVVGLNPKANGGAGWLDRNGAVNRQGKDACPDSAIPVSHEKGIKTL